MSLVSTPSWAKKPLDRILVVDDDEWLNQLVCIFLAEKGFSTIAATSVGQATRIMQTDGFIDLILLDYQLGDGVGMELLEEGLVKTYINMAPVIMISANEDPVFLEECFAGGAADYLIKPINLSLLALKVGALIKSVAMQRLISLQKAELEKFKKNAEREESIAKFTYEYLLRQNNQVIEGVSIWLKPCSSFSGDIALAKRSPSGDLYFMLADATGHGLSAAITIMPLVSIFNSMVAKGFHIQKIVTEINKKLVRDIPTDRFVAAIFIELHKEKKEIFVWNGGMPSAYWLDQGEIIYEFTSQHMALGILDENVFDAGVVSCDFSNEGIIFAYSDGLTEQENITGESFSLPRLLNVLKTDTAVLEKAVVKALQQHACSEEYDDDVSLCIIKPADIFSYQPHNFPQETTSGGIYEAINDFSWHVRVSGKKMAQCEIPPLCNYFLEYIGLNQRICQKVFSVVGEMVSNAIDHGVLGLDSNIKENPDGFSHYFSERDRRFEMLTEKDFIELTLSWLTDHGDARLLISVCDSGAGYDYRERPLPDNMKFSGRGLGLIKNLSRSVEIIAPGNCIKAVIG